MFIDRKPQRRCSRSSVTHGVLPFPLALVRNLAIAEKNYSKRLARETLRAIFPKLRLLVIVVSLNRPLPISFDGTRSTQSSWRAGVSSFAQKLGRLCRSPSQVSRPGKQRAKDLLKKNPPKSERLLSATVLLRRSREFTRVCSPKITHHLVSGVLVSTFFGGTGGPVWPELGRAKQYETGHAGRFQPLFRPTKRFTRLRRG
jgi:hypothetical protein